MVLCRYTSFLAHFRGLTILKDTLHPPSPTNSRPSIFYFHAFIQNILPMWLWQEGSTLHPFDPSFFSVGRMLPLYKNAIIGSGANNMQE